MIKKKGFWTTEYSVHVLMWILYMLYETILIGVLFNSFGNPVVYLSHYAIVILLFYLHANKVLPLALQKNKRLILIVPVVIVMELFFYSYAQFLVTISLDEISLTKSGIKEFDKTFLLRNVYRGVLFLGYSTGYYYLKTYLTERKKTEILEKERLENIIQQQQMEQELVLAQNAFLKAQINPHFLFNTLDFIHYKVSAHSAIAGEAIIRLAEMMRFAIDADDTGKHISLNNEIEQAENLIYLYQIRKSVPLQIDFSYTNEVKSLCFIPLVVLTLMENIFKHAEIYNEEDPAYLQLKVSDGFLNLDTANRLASQQAIHGNQSGLSNIQKRLYYAYGDAAILRYNINQTHFNLSIKVPVSLL